MKTTKTRLLSLFGMSYKDKNDRKFLHNLTNLTVIAGEAVVYALNKSIKSSTVKYIDLYMINSNKRNNRAKEIIDLICSRFCGETTTISSYAHCHESIEGAFPLIKSAFTLIKSAEAKPIKVMVLSYDKPKHVINFFDLSYTKCAYHKGKITITSEAKESHRTKDVILRNDIHSKDKLDKMVNKGFRCIDAIPYYAIDSSSFAYEKGSLLNKCIKNIRNIFIFCSISTEVAKLECHQKYYTSLIMQINPLGIQELNMIIANFCNGDDAYYIDEYLNDNLKDKCIKMNLLLDTIMFDNVSSNKHLTVLKAAIESVLGNRKALPDSDVCRILYILSEYDDVLSICRIDECIRKYLNKYKRLRAKYKKFCIKTTI